MPWQRVLADLIVIIHAGFAVFNVLGLVAILAGVVFRWSWVRNFWFRLFHLVAIGFIVFEEAVDMVCPLTAWESELRISAGQAGYSGDFIGYWVHQLLFFDAEPWVFTVIYVGFGVAVLMAFVLAPPRLPEWLQKMLLGLKNPPKRT